MMMKTISDLAAEMRTLADDIEAGRAIVGQTVWRNYADLFEAAAERERAEIEANALAVGGVIEASRNKPSGDAAAIREALGKIRAELWNNTVIAGKKKFALYEIADIALAKPSRNCDRYSHDEAQRDYAMRLAIERKEWRVKNRA